MANKQCSQYGLISRSQALAAGMTARQVSREVTGGRWVRLHPGVYRLAGSPFTAHARLLAACLATRGMASHESAAWLWGLLDQAPTRPSVLIPHSGPRGVRGVVVHRVGEQRKRPVATLHGIPCTDQYRALVDLAAVASGACLDGAIDRGMAKSIVSMDRLTAEMNRRPRSGRRGVGVLRAALRRRGYIGAPSPSVLESLVLRLLAGGGIRPLAVEVNVEAVHRNYRLDITLAEGLAMEVDGYAYHFDPGAMSRDHRRRNDLARAGWMVLVFTWLDVTRDGPRVLETVRAALSERR